MQLNSYLVGRGALTWKIFIVHKVSKAQKMLEMFMHFNFHIEFPDWKVSAVDTN